MKSGFIKDKNKLVSTVLLGISAVLAVCILIKITAFLVTSVRTGMLVKKAVAQSKLGPGEVEKYFAKPKELAKQIKKKSFFALPPKPEPMVSGILGDEALMNGRWYKVGDKAGDVEILAIEPTQVKIKWQGSEKFLAPIATASPPVSRIPKQVRVKKEEPVKKQILEKKPEEKQTAPLPIKVDRESMIRKFRKRRGK